MEVLAVLSDTGAREAVDVARDETVLSLKRKACEVLLGSPLAVFGVDLRSSDSGSDVLDDTTRCADISVANGEEVVLSRKSVARLRCPYDHRCSSFVFSIAMSPCGRRCYVGLACGILEAWSTETGEHCATFRSSNGKVLSSAETLCEEWVFSGGVGGLSRFALGSGDCKVLLHGVCVSSVKCSPCNRWILAKTRSKLLMFDTDTAAAVRQWEPHHDACIGFALGVSGPHVVCATGSATHLRLWHVSTGQCMRTVACEGLRCLDVSQCGRLIAAGVVPRMVRVYNTDSGACFRVLRGHDHEVCSVAFTPCATYVLSTAAKDWRGYARDTVPSSEVRQWHIDSGTCVRVFQSSQQFTMSPCGTKVVVRDECSNVLHVHPLHSDAEEVP